VIPAGFEPAITGVKGRGPGPLDDGIMVEERRIELRSPRCKRGVIPLYYSPIAFLISLSTSFGVNAAYFVLIENILL
jgi:hypothetical protein